MIYWCVKNCILEEDNIPESAFCLAVKIQFLFSVSVIQLSRSENLQTTLESDWIRRMSQNDAVAIRELPTVIRQPQCNVSGTRSKSVAMNADWSTLPFLICKFIQEVLGIDINLSAQLKISVQVFCPTSLQNPYEIRYIPWMMIKPQKGV